MNSDQVDFVFNCFHPETSRKDGKKNTLKIIFLHEYHSRNMEFIVVNINWNLAVLLKKTKGNQSKLNSDVKALL